MSKTFLQPNILWTVEIKVEMVGHRVWEKNKHSVWPYANCQAWWEGGEDLGLKQPQDLGNLQSLRQQWTPLYTNVRPSVQQLKLGSWNRTTSQAPYQINICIAKEEKPKVMERSDKSPDLNPICKYIRKVTGWNISSKLSFNKTDHDWTRITFCPLVIFSLI